MNVLLLGSGGREHAIAWKLSQSSLLDNLYIAPGNAGTAQTGTNIQINPLDFTAIGSFAHEKDIHLVIVGPEEPLVKGIRDYFELNPELEHIALIGPGSAGAKLEGSKDFAKRFMKKHKIPTARYKSFTAATLDKGLKYLDTIDAPYVLKADGLAAGKGVLILDDLNEAKKELQQILTQSRFGVAGDTIVIENFLDGIEMSVFILTDGINYKILPEAKDYKRIGVGDTGLNTGGMGAVSPVCFADEHFLKKVENRIIKPTISGLQSENIQFNGFIFFGLMNVKGDPFMIEYNVRLGDPEAEVIIPRIKNDLLQSLIALSENHLNNVEWSFDSNAAATIMLVSGGYPGHYEKGNHICGLNNIHDSIVFHAGTKKDENGNLLTNGGRVIALTTLMPTIEKALDKSYHNAELIQFESKYYRTDIGADLISIDQIRN